MYEMRSHTLSGFGVDFEMFYYNQVLCTYY